MCFIAFNNVKCSNNIITIVFDCYLLKKALVKYLFKFICFDIEYFAYVNISFLPLKTM